MEISTLTPTSKTLLAESLQLKKSSFLIRAINHKLRQQILKTLHEHERLKVTDIYRKLRIEQSVASQQLAILRRAGFVDTQRESRNVFYFINYERLHQVNEVVRLLHQCP